MSTHFANITNESHSYELVLFPTPHKDQGTLINAYV